MAQDNLRIDAILLEGRPVCNRIIHVLVEGIQALDGSVMNGDIESFYTTCFDPFYSNAMRVRFKAGEFLVSVPDDTINQFVWYFSRQADLMNYRPDRSTVNPTSYASYRSRWVTAATVVTLLSGTSVNGKLQKRLGDLSIARTNAATELLNTMRDELAWLTSVLEDGGNYGREMQTVSKAGGHPDAPVLSREFTREDRYSGQKVPGANIRSPFVRGADGRLLNRWKKTWGR